MRVHTNISFPIHLHIRSHREDSAMAPRQTCLLASSTSQLGTSVTHTSAPNIQAHKSKAHAHTHTSAHTYTHTQAHKSVELAMEIVNKTSHDSVDGQNIRYTQLSETSVSPAPPDFNVVYEPSRRNVAYRLFCPQKRGLQINIEMRGCRGDAAKKKTICIGYFVHLQYRMTSY